MPTEKKNRFWVNAERIMEITGLDKYGMLRLRRDNPDWWDKVNGRYVYDENSIPESMLKKVAA